MLAKSKSIFALNLFRNHLQSKFTPQIGNSSAGNRFMGSPALALRDSGNSQIKSQPESFNKETNWHSEKRLSHFPLHSLEFLSWLRTESELLMKSPGDSSDSLKDAGQRRVRNLNQLLRKRLENEHEEISKLLWPRESAEISGVGIRRPVLHPCTEEHENLCRALIHFYASSAIKSRDFGESNVFYGHVQTLTQHLLDTGAPPHPRPFHLMMRIIASRPVNTSTLSSESRLDEDGMDQEFGSKFMLDLDQRLSDISTIRHWMHFLGIRDDAATYTAIYRSFINHITHVSQLREENPYRTVENRIQLSHRLLKYRTEMRRRGILDTRSSWSAYLYAQYICGDIKEVLASLDEAIRDGNQDWIEVNHVEWALTLAKRQKHALPAPKFNVLQVYWNVLLGTKQNGEIRPQTIQLLCQAALSLKDFDNFLGIYADLRTQKDRNAWMTEEVIGDLISLGKLLPKSSQNSPMTCTSWVHRIIEDSNGAYVNPFALSVVEQIASVYSQNDEPKAEDVSSSKDENNFSISQFMANLVGEYEKVNNTPASWYLIRCHISSIPELEKRFQYFIRYMWKCNLRPSSSVNALRKSSQHGSRCVFYQDSQNEALINSLLMDSLQVTDLSIPVSKVSFSTDALFDSYNKSLKVGSLSAKQLTRCRDILTSLFLHGPPSREAKNWYLKIWSHFQNEIEKQDISSVR